MKASDTILSVDEILKIRGNDNSFEPADIKRIKRLNKYLSKQAEISFKAGEQESDKKWRQILKDSINMAKLAGIKEKEWEGLK